MNEKGCSRQYMPLVRLGVPIVIGQIGNIVLGFADTLMVGHHSMEELAAASFVNTMIMLFVIFAMGFSYGLTPVVGGRYGRGETDTLGGVARAGLVANTFLAVILLAVLAVFYACIDRMGQPDELLPLMRPYLAVNIISMPFVCWMNTFKQFFDAIGDTKVSMCVLLGGNVMNIAGNWLLIYGVGFFPELGLLGAGISTLASRVAMAVVFALLFFLSRRYASYGRGFMTGGTDWRVLRRLNVLGWPLALQMGMETAAFSLSAVLVGWIGTTALAAHQVVITVSQLFYMIYYGMGAAVAVRASYFHGQGDVDSARATAVAGFRIILIIACVVSVPIFMLRGEISYWFTDSDEVGALVAQTVVPLIVYQFGDGLQCTFANALRGISYVKPLMFIAFFSYFVVSLPLGWLLGIHLGLGLVGVWWAFPVCLTCAGILYYTCFMRRLRREAACGTVTVNDNN